MNEVKLNSEISNENLGDLLVAAFEGGINYWCDKIKIITNPENAEYASEVVATGGVVRLLVEEEWKELTKEMLLSGIARYCQEQKILPDEMMENHDAETADIIVQYAIFNELIYG